MVGSGVYEVQSLWLMIDHIMRILLYAGQSAQTQVELV